MPRKFALAVSLALTTIVTFGIVAVGAQVGFFSEHKSAKAAQASAAPPAPNVPAPAAPDAQPVAANDDPLVVTDYISIDQTPVPIRMVRPRTASAAVAQSRAVAAQSKAMSSSSPDAARHDDTTQPAQPTAADPASAPSPTSVPPTSAPPTQAAAPSATPPAPTASPRPASTSTPAPAQPSPTAPPSLSSEIEFVGTVTDINGNMVTFAHNGTTTVVRMSQSVAVGQRLHVHALLRGGIYVATESEGD